MNITVKVVHPVIEALEQFELAERMGSQGVYTRVIEMLH